MTLYPADLKEIVNQREYEVAGRIVRDVEDAFGLSFPLEEIAYIAIHLLGTKMAMRDEGGTLHRNRWWMRGFCVWFAPP